MLLVFNPEKYILSVYNGFLMFALNVLPALFPFFFLTKLLTSIGTVNSITSFMKKPVKKILKMPSCFSYIFFLSILSGYPVGAKLVSEVAQGDKHSVTRLAAVCSTSGPVFIVGTVGFSMLGCKNAGFVLYSAHICAVVLFALISALFVKNKNEISYNPPVPNDKALSESIYNSVISILIVGGFIALFYMFIDMLGSMFIYGLADSFFSKLFMLAGLPEELCKGFLNGITEITRGCNDISKATAPLNFKLCFCAFIVTFGGLCITMQSLAFLKGKILIKRYLVYKFIQSVMAAVICFIMCIIFNI